VGEGPHAAPSGAKGPWWGRGYKHFGPNGPWPSSAAIEPYGRGSLAAQVVGKDEPLGAALACCRIDESGSKLHALRTLRDRGRPSAVILYHWTYTQMF
jgi:hypothetical protein